MLQQQQTTIIANTKSTTSSSYLINNSISNLRGWLIKVNTKNMILLIIVSYFFLNKKDLFLFTLQQRKKAKEIG